MSDVLDRVWNYWWPPSSEVFERMSSAHQDAGPFANPTQLQGMDLPKHLPIRDDLPLRVASSDESLATSSKMGPKSMEMGPKPVRHSRTYTDMRWATTASSSDTKSVSQGDQEIEYDASRHVLYSNINETSSRSNIMTISKSPSTSQLHYTRNSSGGFNPKPYRYGRGSAGQNLFNQIPPPYTAKVNSCSCCENAKKAVAMVELQINKPTAVPEWLFVTFAVCTTILVSVHIFALMISTYLLPSIDAVSKLHVSSLVTESPHDRMKTFIELAWAFSTILGLLLFLVEIAILCWVKFWDYSFTAAMSATMIVIPVLVVFVAFAMHFYHSLVVIKCKTSVTNIQELENIKKQLDRVV